MNERIPWASMTPEERDLLVAEKVMGWRPAGHLALPPRYSQSMDAAWLVVEHITQPPTSREAALQMANTRFAHWFDGAHLWSESTQEAAQAICVAALRSLGYAVEADLARPWQDL